MGHREDALETRSPALHRFLAGFGAGRFASLHRRYAVVKRGQLSSSVSPRTCENKGIKNCEAICCYGDEAHLGTEEPGLETNMFPCTTYLEYGWAVLTWRGGSASSNTVTDSRWGQTSPPSIVTDMLC